MKFSLENSGKLILNNFKMAKKLKTGCGWNDRLKETEEWMQKDRGTRIAIMNAIPAHEYADNILKGIRARERKGHFASDPNYDNFL